VLTPSEIERERYEASLKGMRDQSCFLSAAREQAFKEGVIIGELMGRIQGCQTYLNLPVTPREELEQLPLSELIRLKEKLQQWVFPPPVEADQPIAVSAADHSSTRTHLP
jgi:hypothetical protein